MTAVSIILLILLALLFAAAAAYGVSLWRAGRGFLPLAGGLLAAIVTFVIVSTLTASAIAAWFQ